ncbi:MAG: 3'-5' exonuclease [bacterium]
MENKTVVIFDTETTGFIEPALIEAGGIIIQGSPFDGQTKTFLSRYNPGKLISFGVIATHNILDSELENSPPASEFKLPENTGYLVGHNIDYDWQVISSPDIRRIDTLAMASDLWPELDSHGLAALNYALTPIADRLKIRDIIINGNHNALTDAKLCLNVLRYILKEKPELNSWGAIWKYSEESRIPKIMPFGKHKGTPIKDLPSDYV